MRKTPFKNYRYGGVIESLGYALENRLAAKEGRRAQFDSDTINRRMDQADVILQRNGNIDHTQLEYSGKSFYNAVTDSISDGSLKKIVKK